MKFKFPKAKNTIQIKNACYINIIKNTMFIVHSNNNLYIIIKMYNNLNMNMMIIDEYIHIYYIYWFNI